jgi:hypothetical protein
MDNDIVRKMNRGLGIGLALGVSDNQRFEHLRESHREDAEAERAEKEAVEAGASTRVRNTHFFRGEELPGPPLRNEAGQDVANK